MAATEINGNTTHDVDDVVVGIKIRAVPEGAHHPAFAFRFWTRLPDAEWQRGIGLDTTDFSGALLIAKTVRSVRMVGNIGGGILGDPTNGHRQNDDLLYGLSLARAITDRAEMVGEINGRWSTRTGEAFPGTESRSLLKFGGRYTRGSVRLDAAVDVRSHERRSNDWIHHRVHLRFQRVQRAVKTALTERDFLHLSSIPRPAQLGADDAGRPHDGLVSWVSERAERYPPDDGVAERHSHLVPNRPHELRANHRRPVRDSGSPLRLLLGQSRNGLVS